MGGESAAIHPANSRGADERWARVFTGRNMLKKFDPCDYVNLLGCVGVTAGARHPSSVSPPRGGRLGPGPGRRPESPRPAKRFARGPGHEERWQSDVAAENDRWEMT